VRAEYKAHIVALRTELDDARELRDAEHIARLENEIDLVTRELKAAFGLGGRGRRVGSAAEQARVNITKNIGRALSQIEASNESLGNMLRLTIKTGLFCAYNPDPRFPITWGPEPVDPPTILASVGAGEPTDDSATASVASEKFSSDGAPWRAVVVTAAIGALALAAIVLGVARWRSTTPATAGRPAASRRIRSIAVLPLENLSGDPAQEYFADGMTDELITDLAKISSLRVISRTSVMRYKGEHHQPLSAIAKALKVDAVVEGSAMRTGSRVRITAQLIDAADDKHLWAETYERDSRDVLSMQDELASAIAQQIDVELTPNEQARFAQSRPVNPEAHEAYLKGRYYYSRQSEERVNKAIEQYELAIKLDPNFAPAYTGLADAYLYGEGFYFAPSVAIPKTKWAIEEALRLDDTSAEVHTSLGYFKYVFAYDWAGAETELRRAIALNSSYAEAHHQYGWVLALQGREDDGLVEFKRAIELDPLSPRRAAEVAEWLTYQGKYEAAKQQCSKALDLDPNFGPQCIWKIDLEDGEFRKAIAEMEKGNAQESSPLDVGWLGYCYAASGNSARAKEMLKKLNQMASQRYVTPLAEAFIYIGLGDRERALDRLEQVYQTGSSMLGWLKVDHMYDPLRSEPRFIALLKKTGLEK
jgi:TolB-like protein/Tfp pilus assembly protein PilF